MNPIFYTNYQSPVGALLLAGTQAALELLSFSTGPKARQPAAGWRDDRNAFQSPIEQLDAYFAGELKTFSLALSPEGTPFQLAVWRELQRIPYGETISYGELAQRIGNPAASRAVGLANGANPIAIIVPCHRVIGANGRLTGFGGGLDMKRRLLEHESGQQLLGR